MARNAGTLARNAGTKVQRTFTKGLITEATGLNFPENSCTDTLNCVFDEKGRVTRRLGFEYEVSYETDTYDRSGGVTTEFYWENAGEDGLSDLVVIQMENMLYFYKESLTNSLSSGNEGLSINLNTYAAAGTTNIPLYHCQFTQVSGKLFVTHPLCEPFYLEYDSTTPSITGTEIAMRIRDLEGDTADTYYNDARTRPTATTATVGSAHMYNLYNQGWAGQVRTIAPSTANPVTFWDSVLTTIPSNGDVWFLFKDANELFDPVNWADRTGIGNVLAPKGFYILNPFDTDRATQSGFSGVTETSSNGVRPSCVAAYAGRIWYAGVNASGFSQKIYFSQIIVKDDEYGKCYQSNDPTSETAPDLLPTDGGVLSIPEVGTIIKLLPIQSQLFVFGTNGVWMISGSQGLGFNPTDYSVVKVSSTPALSSLSFVDVFGAPMWWNTDGIYTIATDQLSGNASAKSVSDTTIRALLDDIHPTMKRYVKGVFNKYTKTVQWLYRSANTSDQEERYEYDRALVYNVLSGAFYPWTLPNANPTINGLIVSRGPSSGTVTESVVNSGSSIVTTTGLETVTAEVYTTLNPNYSFRYLTTKKTGATSFTTTWSQTINTTYKDWGEVETAIDYDSYFFTNYELDGDGQRFFQNNYIVVYLDAVSNGSCFFEPWWEYTTTTSNARVANPQQVYPPIGSFSTLQRRLKVRGKGRSVQFKFYSEEGKPFSVVGWSIWSTQNSGI